MVVWQIHCVTLAIEATGESKSSPIGCSMKDFTHLVPFLYIFTSAFYFHLPLADSAGAKQSKNIKCQLHVFLYTQNMSPCKLFHGVFSLVGDLFCLSMMLCVFGLEM